LRRSIGMPYALEGSGGRTYSGSLCHPVSMVISGDSPKPFSWKAPDQNFCPSLFVAEPTRYRSSTWVGYLITTAGSTPSAKVKPLSLSCQGCVGGRTASAVEKSAVCITTTTSDPSGERVAAGLSWIGGSFFDSSGQRPVNTGAASPAGMTYAHVYFSHAGAGAADAAAARAGAPAVVGVGAGVVTGAGAGVVVVGAGARPGAGACAGGGAPGWGGVGAAGLAVPPVPAVTFCVPGAAGHLPAGAGDGATADTAGAGHVARTTASGGVALELVSTQTSTSAASTRSLRICACRAAACAQKVAGRSLCLRRCIASSRFYYRRAGHWCC